MTISECRYQHDTHLECHSNAEMVAQDLDAAITTANAKR